MHLLNTLTHELTGFFIAQIVVEAGVLFAFLKGTLKATMNRNKYQDEALRAILQRRLRQDILRCLEKGCCTINEKEDIDRMFLAYKNLKGNGTIEKLYNRYDAKSKIKNVCKDTDD